MCELPQLTGQLLTDRAESRDLKGLCKPSSTAVDAAACTVRAIMHHILGHMRLLWDLMTYIGRVSLEIRGSVALSIEACMTQRPDADAR